MQRYGPKVIKLGRVCQWTTARPRSDRAAHSGVLARARSSLPIRKYQIAQTICHFRARTLAAALSISLNESFETLSARLREAINGSSTACPTSSCGTEALNWSNQALSVTPTKRRTMDYPLISAVFASS